MPKLTWDNPGEHFYRTGVSDVALYVQASDGTYEEGVAWSGVTSIEESPDGGDANDFYADNIKYLSLRAVENYGATINAYQSPEEFDACDGIATLSPGIKIGQQVRKPFGLVWKTKIGNDTDGTDKGYELHIVYNATASPSSKTYETINDSPEPAELSWEMETTPISVSGHKPTSHLVIDSLTCPEAKLTLIINKLYGTDASGGSEGTAPTLLSPDKILELIA